MKREFIHTQTYNEYVAALAWLKKRGVVGYFGEDLVNFKNFMDWETYGEDTVLLVDTPDDINKSSTCWKTTARPLKRRNENLRKAINIPEVKSIVDGIEGRHKPITTTSKREDMIWEVSKLLLQAMPFNHLPADGAHVPDAIIKQAEHFVDAFLDKYKSK